MLLLACCGTWDLSAMIYQVILLLHVKNLSGLRKYSLKVDGYLEEQAQSDQCVRLPTMVGQSNIVPIVPKFCNGNITFWNFWSLKIPICQIR